MAMTMPDLAAFQAIPMQQTLAMLDLALVGIGVGLYFYVEEPLQEKITSLKSDIAKLDTEINTNKIKIAKLEDLKQLNAELQRRLSKNQEYLPPEEEAVTLLKQLSDLGTRIGLDRSEEHTSELQSRPHLVCRLLLEKKKKKQYSILLCQRVSTQRT